MFSITDIVTGTRLTCRSLCRGCPLLQLLLLHFQPLLLLLLLLTDVAASARLQRLALAQLLKLTVARLKRAIRHTSHVTRHTSHATRHDVACGHL